MRIRAACRLSSATVMTENLQLDVTGLEPRISSSLLPCAPRQNTHKVSGSAVNEVEETQNFDEGTDCFTEITPRYVCVGTENTFAITDNWLIINDVIVGAP